MLVLVVYDSPDDRRRTKLATFLEGYGRRVQKSVFECYLTLVEMAALHQQLERRVVPDEDDVRLYWVPVDAVPRTLTIGSLPPGPPPESYVI